MTTRKDIEESLAHVQELAGYADAAMTEIGLVKRMLLEARQDAKDWMTKYQIERDVAVDAETKRANIMREMSSLTAQRNRAERKNRLLASTIATLIDSEEFV